MKIIIDRFEGNIAIVELENGIIIDCPKAILPPNAKDGSIIDITINEKATEEKLQEITNKMNRLLKD